MLEISITDLYAYCILFEYLFYKVLIFCLCGLFGGNSLLIWTTLPYNYNSAIQGGCQLLLNMSITDLYAYCIFFESLLYKVLIFFCVGHLVEIAYLYELLCHIIINPPNEQAISLLENFNSYQYWYYLPRNHSLWFEHTIQVSS